MGLVSFDDKISGIHLKFFIDGFAILIAIILYLANTLEHIWVYLDLLWLIYE